MGSCSCHTQVPSWVPASSSQVTTTAAPTYTGRDGPQSRNPARQRNQKNPRPSRRSASSQPYDAQAPIATPATTASAFRCGCTGGQCPSAQAERNTSPCPGGTYIGTLWKR